MQILSRTVEQGVVIGEDTDQISIILKGIDENSANIEIQCSSSLSLFKESSKEFVNQRMFRFEKEDQIRIGNDIVITLIDIKSDEIRMGVDAPREMNIQKIGN